MSKVSKPNIPIGHSPLTPHRRHITVRPIDASGSTFINPIERWSDHNYAPYELDYVYNQNTASSEVVAPLHGYHTRDVHVTITRGTLIILLSDDEDVVCSSKQEFYCEIPLPRDVRHNDAFVEIGTHFLTVHLVKKQLFFKRVTNAAMRLRNSFAFFFGKSWNLGRLDE